MDDADFDCIYDDAAAAAAAKLHEYSGIEYDDTCGDPQGKNKKESHHNLNNNINFAQLAAAAAAA